MQKNRDIPPDGDCGTADAPRRRPVGYMPLLGTDELVYSWVSRYSWGTGSLPGALVRRELFGPTPNHMSVLLTGDLRQLAEVLPPGAPDADGLADHHTLYRYHAPFMAEEASTRLRGMLLDGWEAGVQSWFGSRRATIPAKAYLSFCPECVQEDSKEVGEPTWRRAHQLPGTEICHAHSVRLRYGCWETGHTTVLQPCPRSVDVYPDQPRLLPHGIATNFAREGARLLTEAWDFGNRPRLRAGLARIVCEAGFGRGGRIQRTQLEAHIRREIGQKAMVAFGLVSPSSRSPGSLHAVHEIRAPAFSPPCRFLLVLAVLHASLRDLRTAVANVPPPGDPEPPRPPMRYRLSEERLLFHKGRLSEAMRQNPHWSRIDLFTNVRRSYSAVTRHDWSWWDSSAPPCHPRTRRLDYARRDVSHSALIEAAASRLVRIMPLHRRITKVAVLREAGLPTGLNLSPRLSPLSHSALLAAIRPSGTTGDAGPIAHGQLVGPSMEAVR